VDIHSPENSIRTWKDFLLHLLTITIGLFIALMLEAAVESMHNRHLVREARENLRSEIENNHQLYAENARKVQLNRIQLAHDLDQLRALRDGKLLSDPRLSWTSNWWNGYGDAAWKTAKESGAVPHMDSRAISDYTWLYDQQVYVMSMALTLLNEESRINAVLVVAQEPLKLLPAEIESLMIRTAEIDLEASRLQTWMKALDDMYSRALTKP
jgi:hypothetical protein